MHYNLNCITVAFDKTQHGFYGANWTQEIHVNNILIILGESTCRGSYSPDNEEHTQVLRGIKKGGNAKVIRIKNFKVWMKEKNLEISKIIFSSPKV